MVHKRVIVVQVRPELGRDVRKRRAEDRAQQRGRRVPRAQALRDEERVERREVRERGRGAREEVVQRLDGPFRLRARLKSARVEGEVGGGGRTLKAVSPSLTIPLARSATGRMGLGMADGERRDSSGAPRSSAKRACSGSNAAQNCSTYAGSTGAAVGLVSLADLPHPPHPSATSHLARRGGNIQDEEHADGVQRGV